MKQCVYKSIPVEYDNIIHKDTNQICHVHVVFIL